MPEIFDIEYDFNGNCTLLGSILLSGEYDLIISLFLIIQLLKNKKLKENSDEIIIINEMFDLMINTKFKFMINFLLTTYKSIEKYLYYLIQKYFQKKFPENIKISEKDYKEYMNLFDANENIVNENKEAKEIQIFYNNWG